MIQKKPIYWCGDLHKLETKGLRFPSRGKKGRSLHHSNDFPVVNSLWSATWVALYTELFFSQALG